MLIQGQQTWSKPEEQPRLTLPWLEQLEGVSGKQNRLEERQARTIFVLERSPPAGVSPLQ